MEESKMSVLNSWLLVTGVLVGGYVIALAMIEVFYKRKWRNGIEE